MMKTGEVMRHRLKNNKGFTLIEAVAVLVILGIISAVVISRGMDTREVELQAEIDTLKGHLRYAQYLALNQNDATSDVTLTTKWGIRQETQNSYTLIKDESSNQTSPYSLPGESSATHDASFAVSGTVLFDEWGRPDNGASMVIGGQTITITPETGYIP